MPRADAEQNRARIIEAARLALEDSGDATMQSIARRAGIGQGTLYRHFPTRESLVMTVHRGDVRELVEAAPILLAAHPADEALRLWFDRLAAYGRIKRGLLGALHTVMHAELSSEGYEPVVRAIGLLLDAGVHAGTIRADVEPEEVLLLVGFLWRIDGDADREVRATHLLDVVTDGLRAQSTGR